MHAFGLDDQEEVNEEAHQENQFQDQEMNEPDAPEEHPEDALSNDGYVEQDNQQYLHMDLYQADQRQDHEGELQSVEDANEARDLQQDYHLEPEYERVIEHCE